MCRPKHRNDHNHAKSGFVGGNPRYSDCRANRVDNRVELEDESEEAYLDYLEDLNDMEMEFMLEHEWLDSVDDYYDGLHLDHDLSCFEDDDLPVEPMLMSFGRNSIEEGGMFYEGYWD